MMAGTLVFPVLVLAAWVSGVCDAGCADRAAPSCCPGRNNECVERSSRRTVCYCDAYCRRSGDCCDDYRSVCHASALDCAVGPWGAWSPCSSVCGAGTTERIRQVVTPPRNGGTPCPDLKQRRGCFAHTETCSAAKEVAKILPDSFKRNFKDPWRRPHMLMKEEKKSYCVQMRIKQSSAVCKVKPWSAGLVPERSVCVECQSDAMTTDSRCRGDGLKNIRTFWTTASAPGCSGSWVRESFTENCRCPPYSTIFV
ncbi:hypothetical protein DNTS_014485 [Danionella cerebrum]|uniref:SMB domain-containing protein n=2 Tax=Danionella cerebrum TaxID=2873325 RepID=A0A553R3L1_9TELE|nr:hypothetical protein DNTS_014485 [Danionella translucida]